MSNGYQITEEELIKCNWVDRPRLLWMEDQELLDDWLPLMEEVVGILEEAYRKSFQLFESGQFQREPILGQLEHALMTAISELEVVKGWRASCCNTSSDKECGVLKGEEDTSEGKVLKEGSEAGQSANQQADCGKKKMCRCESCQWRLRHE